LVQFTGWLAWFTFLLYITAWVGEQVFQGDAYADASTDAYKNYQAGVRWGALGLCINAGVTSAVSLILPKLAVWPGIKPVYFAGQIILGVCLLSTFWIKDKIGALVVIGALGIPWSCVMVFPFSLVAYTIEDDASSGMYMGVLNIFVVIPQIVISVGIGFIIDQFSGNLSAALATGGIFAFVSAITVWFLIIPEQDRRTSVRVN